MLSGIYYLWDGAAVLYIGASCNVARRIREHALSGLDFAGYFFDPCQPHELADREAIAIKEFQPLLNEHQTTRAGAPSTYRPIPTKWRGGRAARTPANPVTRTPISKSLFTG